MTTLARTLAALLLAATATLASAAPGGPVKGETIKAGRNPGGSFQQVTTGADGSAGFDTLEPGSYWVSVTPPKGSSAGRYAVTVQMGEKDRVARVVSAAPGVESEHIDFDLKGKAAVRVVVTEAGDQGARETR